MKAASRNSGGFTLIEVLAAVAILAIALAAIISGMVRYADEAGYLRDKTYALLVAHNRLTEMELDPAWPPLGKSDDTVELADTEWKWHVEVSETQDDRLRRIDIGVQRAHQDGDLASLSAFIANTGRQ